MASPPAPLHRWWRGELPSPAVLSSSPLIQRSWRGAGGEAMKLVLYNPRSNAGGKAILPMSLLALGAVLEGRHDYRIVDGNLTVDPLAALDRAIRETEADVLGVTVMPGPQLSQAVPLCRELKERFPRLRIVWGGYFP